MLDNIVPKNIPYIVSQVNLAISNVYIVSPIAPDTYNCIIQSNIVWHLSYQASSPVNTFFMQLLNVTVQNTKAKTTPIKLTYTNYEIFRPIALNMLPISGL